MQTLGCMNDQRSNPKLKRRCEQDIFDPSISQWEQASSVEPLRRQSAGGRLEPPAPMQSPCLPTNGWDVANLLTPRMNNQHSHVQRPFMTNQADNTIYHPITHNTDSSLFPAGPNSHRSMYTLGGAHGPHLLVPQLQPHSPSDDPSTLNLSDDLLAVWSNPPTARCVLLSHLDI